jgi:ATP synthase protein I
VEVEPADAGRMSISGRVLLTQLLVTMAAGAAGLAYSLPAGYSALLGGLICVIPNAGFVRKVFAEGAEGPPGLLFGQMIRGEIAKIVLAGFMFAVIFASVEELVLIALIVAYLLAHAAGIVSVLALSGGDNKAPPSRDTKR